MQVNGQEANPGCYIDSHWGQYGPDRVADICEQFDIEVHDDDDPRIWRAIAEADNVEDATYAGKLIHPDDAWEFHVESSYTLEQRLNGATTGGYWTWEDGELYLIEQSDEEELSDH